MGITSSQDVWLKIYGQFIIFFNLEPKYSSMVWPRLKSDEIFCQGQTSPEVENKKISRGQSGPTMTATKLCVPDPKRVVKFCTPYP